MIECFYFTLPREQNPEKGWTGPAFGFGSVGGQGVYRKEIFEQVSARCGEGGRACLPGDEFFALTRYL